MKQSGGALLVILFTLTLNAQKPGDPTPLETPLAAGGTPTTLAVTNVIPKFTDGSGTLGDSTITDTGTAIGIGTTNPGARFDLQTASGSNLLMRVFNTGTGGATLRYVSANGATSQLQLTDHAEWLASIATTNSTGLQFRVRNAATINNEGGLDASTRMTITRAGNVGIGTTTPTSALQVVGNITATGAIGAKYQDIAEWVDSTTELDAGTVVVLNSERTNEVMRSHTAYDTRVAGVVSAQPGIVLGEQTGVKAQVATLGRVRVRADATGRAIRVGDLLVTSNSPGEVMASTPFDMGGIAVHRPGTLVGKALEPLASGHGEILILLSLQ